MADKNKKDEPENEAEEGAPAEGGAEGAPAEGEGGGGFSQKKLILFVAVPILALVGIGAGLYFSGMLDSLLGKKEAVECAEHDEKCKEEQAAAGEEGEGEEGGHGGGGHGEGGSGAAFLEIPTMIVNLNSEGDTPRYLRLSVQIELKNAADKDAIAEVMPRVVDQFQTYLRELKVKDLRGSAGIYRLQMELLWRVNQAAAPIEVKDVLFQEILIQ